MIGVIDGLIENDNQRSSAISIYNVTNLNIDRQYRTANPLSEEKEQKDQQVVMSPAGLYNFQLIINWEKAVV